ATAVALVTALLPQLAGAQSNFEAVAAADSQAPPGWVFTPSLAVGTSWDNNVLVQPNDTHPPRDAENTIGPRGTLGYNGARGTLSASYDGTFFVYRTLNQLNSFDQRLSFSARRQTSPHTAFFVRDYAAIVPTTELVQLVAVPFVRAGSHVV